MRKLFSEDSLSKIVRAKNSHIVQNSPQIGRSDGEQSNRESSFVKGSGMEFETALGLALPWMLTSMVVAISELSAACINIRTVIGVSCRHDFARFGEFLKILETYGDGYKDDIDYRNFRHREKTSHRSDAIRIIRDILTSIGLCEAQVNELQKSELTIQFMAFLNCIKEGFEKLE